MITTENKDIVRNLYNIGAVKFGEFKLKSGLLSPFYFDLRLIVSFPELMDKIAVALCLQIDGLKFNHVTGIPYTALPIATLVSAKLNVPLIYMRKEQKSYGTGQKIEGSFNSGETVLVIDDLITTGSSKVETIQGFEAAGLNVTDISVAIDRSIDGSDFLKKNNVQLHSLITLQDIIDVLSEDGVLDTTQVAQIRDFQPSQIRKSDGINSKPSENKITQRLKHLIQSKQTHLTASLDVTDQSAFFNILESIADEILMVKTHVDILEDFDSGFIDKLTQLSNERNFIIFEDRKFADIGNTVYHQYTQGIYKISEWAEAVTIHLVAGEGTIQGIFRDKPENRSSFLLAKMSSKGNLMSLDFTKKVFETGERFPKFVSGFICHEKTPDGLKRMKSQMPSGFLMLTPGVSLDSSGDNLGQQYITAKTAIEGGSNIIIVGRGIYGKIDANIAARHYKEQAWEAWEQVQTEMSEG